jgi:hypothetical protein
MTTEPTEMVAVAVNCVEVSVTVTVTAPKHCPVNVQFVSVVEPKVTTGHVLLPYVGIAHL